MTVLIFRKYQLVEDKFMKKIILLFVITLCGSLSWMLGDSFGIMTAYLMSFAGNLVGVVLGAIINQRYLN